MGEETDTMPRTDVTQMAFAKLYPLLEIGRASCRERV